jgi:death on curing protein
MKWISIEELLFIHEKVIKETGGISGVINFPSIESCLNKPFTSFGGVDVFPEIRDKVACLIHSIISFHPFIDGNKRTALVAADVCLNLNGLCLEETHDLEPFFWEIAKGNKEINEISIFIKNHS